MTEEKKKIEIKFMPGCFDNFEGTQEELDQMVSEIQRLVDSGELFEKAVPVNLNSILDDLSDEEIEDLLNQMDEEDNLPKRTLQ